MCVRARDGGSARAYAELRDRAALIILMVCCITQGWGTTTSPITLKVAALGRGLIELKVNFGPLPLPRQGMCKVLESLVSLFQSQITLPILSIHINTEK